MPDLIRSALRRLQPLASRAQGSTWILSYHLVEGGTGLAIDVSRGRFAEHLDALNEQAEVVALRALVRELRAGRGAMGAASPQASDAARCTAATDRPRVVLTFDDAFDNFYEVVLPLVLERSFAATLYVPPGFVNGDGNHPLYQPRFKHLLSMSWGQLREAAAAGIEIGSHTYRHTNLARLATPELVEELRRSQEEIEENLGVRPASVCYPEGFTTAQVCRVAARFYESGVVGGGRPVDRGSELLRLPRLPIRADMSAEALTEVLERSVCLEEWMADKVRRLRGRVVARS